MDTAFDRVLGRYTARMEEEHRRLAAGADLKTIRDELLIAVGEEAGRFLHALAIARGARTILELGTSYGYSTLFFADAARRTGGRVISMDVAADKQDYARRQLTDADLADHVEFRCGDALELIDRADEQFDFVLLDIWKEMYIPCLEHFLPKLADNAIIAADNMLEPAFSRPDAEKYRSAVRTHPELQSVLLPIGQGIELSCVWR